MASPEAFPTKHIERIQENLLARSERRLLTWLCARMPAFVTPDRLTFIGMLGALLVFGGYVASNRGDAWLWLSIAGYVVQWFGDSMDGSLARFRRIERPRYGYFLDHSCAGLATPLVVVGIGLSNYVLLEIALVALAGYLLLSIHAFLSVRVLGELKLSYLNAGPTELRLVLIGLTLSMIAAGPERALFGRLTWFDLFVGAVGTLLIVLFVLQTLTTARRLALEEPPRDWRG
jgi:phosphatidylglycerophosphate synthase